MGRVSVLIWIVVLGCSSKEDLECEVGDIDGTAEATLDGAAPHWVLDEVHKLARVLRREPRERMSRWRPDPTAA